MVPSPPAGCARCQRIESPASLEQIGGVPFCYQCAAFVRDRPFPPWLLFAALVLVACVAIAWTRNERFFRALLLMHRAEAAAERSDLGRAKDLTARAARLAPEVQEIGGLAAFYEGIQALAHDRSAEAVILLRRAHSAFPQNKNVNNLVTKAEAGAAFEEKKWDVFVEKSLEIEKQEPSDPTSVAQVASAYACLYAATGQEEPRKRAEEYLERASHLAKPGDPVFAEYRDRIRYRLDTRQILKRQDYLKMRGQTQSAPGKTN